MKDDLLELIINWESKAKIFDKEGSKDCGSNADICYSAANVFRECAKELIDLIDEKEV